MQCAYAVHTYECEASVCCNECECESGTIFFNFIFQIVNRLVQLDDFNLLNLVLQAAIVQHAVAAAAVAVAAPFAR